MEKDDLIKSCRYYKGEEACPFQEQNKSMLWFYERAWVYDTLNDSKSLSITTDEYKSLGLESFEDLDGIPLSLKASLFNRYANSCYSTANEVEPFKQFYKEYYKKEGV